MITDTLHQVTHQFRIEERHGQLKQFDKKVAYQRDVDAHGDMQQEPPSDEVNRCPAEGNNKLPNQY